MKGSFRNSCDVFSFYLILLVNLDIFRKELRMEGILFMHFEQILSLISKYNRTISYFVKTYNNPSLNCTFFFPFRYSLIVCSWMGWQCWATLPTKIITSSLRFLVFIYSSNCLWIITFISGSATFQICWNLDGIVQSLMWMSVTLFGHPTNTI